MAVNCDKKIGGRPASRAGAVRVCDNVYASRLPDLTARAWHAATFHSQRTRKVPSTSSNCARAAALGITLMLNLTHSARNAFEEQAEDQGAGADAEAEERRE
eukprot:1621659-Rhodomonas_salina.1